MKIGDDINISLAKKFKESGIHLPNHISLVPSPAHVLHQPMCRFAESRNAVQASQVVTNMTRKIN